MWDASNHLLAGCFTGLGKKFQYPLAQWMVKQPELNALIHGSDVKNKWSFTLTSSLRVALSLGTYVTVSSAYH
jgi:hypothetical protein